MIRYIAPLVLFARCTGPIRSVLFNEAAKFTVFSMNGLVPDSAFANGVSESQAEGTHSKGFKRRSYKGWRRLRCKCAFVVVHINDNSANLVQVCA